MKKRLYIIFIILCYCMTLFWLVSFKFLNVGDFKSILVLIVGMTLLSMGGYKKGNDLNDIVQSMKWNLQLTAVIVVVLLQMSYFFTDMIRQVESYDIVLNFKPFGFAVIIYLMIDYYEKQVLDKKTDSSESIENEGLTNLEISEKLFIAKSTTKKHIQNSFSKIGVSNRRDLFLMLNEKNIKK